MNKTASIASTKNVEEIKEIDESVKPDFIYGGPFIIQEKADPFLNTKTPINMCLQGTFKRSFAYYTIKERLPVILTKIIDHLSRDSAKIKSETGASEDELKKAIAYISKLKNEIVTNKKYELLTVDTPEAKKWNQWIQDVDIPYYFTNIWVFTECYVYRRIQEALELQPKLKNLDPFAKQKDEAYTTNIEIMCVVANKLVEMLPKQEDKDKRKADFITLLKLCLWANKCDLSLSLGATQESIPDPFKLITDLKDKVLVDDSSKIVDQVISKAEMMAKNIEASATELKVLKSEKSEENVEVKPQIPCPAKMTTPSAVMFDIICDNSGYELFSDLCIAHYLIAQEIVQKVRFHVKSIPWFVSDVTPRDFKFVIDSCMKAMLKKHSSNEESQQPAAALTADSLQALGTQWNRFLQDGTFLLMSDEFWTSPHVYKDMKRLEPNLYRSLQFAVAVMFKGDLNYRKLLGEKNWNPVTGFETALQGFMPAPVIALRTVKADLICGLPKGKFEQLNKLDEQWMEKGDYGVIQFSPKSEPLKVSDRPCSDFPTTCSGATCPTHTDI